MRIKYILFTVILLIQMSCGSSCDENSNYFDCPLTCTVFLPGGDDIVKVNKVFDSNLAEIESSISESSFSFLPWDESDNLLGEEYNKIYYVEIENGESNLDIDTIDLSYTVKRDDCDNFLINTFHFQYNSFGQSGGSGLDSICETKFLKRIN